METGDFAQTSFKKRKIESNEVVRRREIVAPRRAQPAHTNRIYGESSMQFGGRGNF